MTKHSQDWGLQFPASKVETAISKSPLKRVATVDVSNSRYVKGLPLTRCKDVAQQILFLANSASTTGTNSVLDAGLSL